MHTDCFAGVLLEDPFDLLLTDYIEPMLTLDRMLTADLLDTALCGVFGWLREIDPLDFRW